MHNENQRHEVSPYPTYPASDDLFIKGIKEGDIEPDDLSEIKSHNGKNGDQNEENPTDDMSGSDLDIPGSELDDLQEEVGSEDEENNAYSIGGDEHNDLDENQE